MTVVGGEVRPNSAPAGEVLDSHEAYRRGLCVDCRECPHSPGRPRCEQCHSTYVTRGSVGCTASGRSPR